MVLLFTTPALAGPVRVVEADQPLAVRAMKCEGVIEPVRLLWRYRYPPDDELNPMTALRVDDERLPVQIEKRIEGRVARRRHVISLSH